MAQPDSRPSYCLQKECGTEDVEKSLEVLDKVLSEFEESDSLPPIIQPESPSQGHQSEDDGYMSMNGRRTKFAPTFQPTDECTMVPYMMPQPPPPVLPQTSSSSSFSSFTASTVVGKKMEEANRTCEEPTNGMMENAAKNYDNNDSVSSKTFEASTSGPLFSSPPPEDTERIIENILPRVSLSSSPTRLAQSTSSSGDYVSATEDATGGISARTLQHQRNKDRFDRLFGKTSRDLKLVRPNHSQPLKDGGVSLVTILQDNGRRNQTEDENESIKSAAQIQSTLPKARANISSSSAAIPGQTTRFGSLPSSAPPKFYSWTANIYSAGRYSLDEGRECAGRNRNSSRRRLSSGRGSEDSGNALVLGMGISAVHDAVLRGVPKIPESIVNEHPVTIYPGRASPTNRRCMPPRTLPGTLERHREVCRKNQPENSMSSDSSNSTEGTVDEVDNVQEQQQLHREEDARMIATVTGVFGQQDEEPCITSSSQLLQQQKLLSCSPPLAAIIVNRTNATNGVIAEYSINTITSSEKRIGCATSSMGKFKKSNNGYKATSGQKFQRTSEDSEDFSEDSLEDTSLPPPPPPPVVPPPPSLSCPVTPNKRGSIAWEINLDEPIENRGSAESDKVNSTEDAATTSPEMVLFRGKCGSGSQSSMASTPGQSMTPTSDTSPKQSDDWPDPPVTDLPICSTEDEAASLYSDSDDIVPYPPPAVMSNIVNNGTYVIRKGRKQRQRIPEMDDSKTLITGTCSIIPSSKFIPSSRHSVDMGDTESASSIHPLLISRTIHVPYPANNTSAVGCGGGLKGITNSNSNASRATATNLPRSRLSLDLISPSDQQQQAQVTIAQLICTQKSTSPASTPTTITSDSLPIPVPGNENNGGGGGFIISPRYKEFKTYSSTFDGLQALEQSQTIETVKSVGTGSNTNIAGGQAEEPLQHTVRVAPAGDPKSTPRRGDLVPPLEEDEEQDSESQRGAPLRQIESNISALLRGDIPIGRVADIPSASRRPVGFRPGVHKSESAKEMLLSQPNFGPLPPSPPESPDDGFPPLPPSPVAEQPSQPEMHIHRMRSRHQGNEGGVLHHRETSVPPAVPPHRPSLNTLKTRSMDAGFSKAYRSPSFNSNGFGGGNQPGTLPPELPGMNSKRRLCSAFPKKSMPSPREERRLQTSCSLPETPIFARGCDLPRTPHRRAPDIGSRTAPRTINTSIRGIGTGNTRDNTVRSNSSSGSASNTRLMLQNHQSLLANGEMLRLAGGPARGWYPKQRQTTTRPVSTEHLDRLSSSISSAPGGARGFSFGATAWAENSVGTAGSRKPLTLPPNLTPKFFTSKSPREAIRRVTSLLIRKGANPQQTRGQHHHLQHQLKDSRPEKDNYNFNLSSSSAYRSSALQDVKSSEKSQMSVSTDSGILLQPTPPPQKKKGFFRNFWKKSKHQSIDQ